MDESIVKHLEVKKLSDIVRENGYGDDMDYNDCVLGRAYKAMTGRSLQTDGSDYSWKGRGEKGKPFVRQFAIAAGIPFGIAYKVEKMCMHERKSPAEIADWLESQGY